MRANLKQLANERRSLNAHVDAKECHRVAGDATASIITGHSVSGGTLAGQFLLLLKPGLGKMVTIYEGSARNIPIGYFLTFFCLFTSIIKRGIKIRGNTGGRRSLTFWCTWRSVGQSPFLCASTNHAAFSGRRSSGMTGLAPGQRRQSVLVLSTCLPRAAGADEKCIADRLCKEV
jgi:hypothetical protein